MSSFGQSVHKPLFCKSTCGLAGTGEVSIARKIKHKLKQKVKYVTYSLLTDKKIIFLMF